MIIEIYYYYYYYYYYYFSIHVNIFMILLLMSFWIFEGRAPLGVILMFPEGIVFAGEIVDFLDKTHNIM